MRCGIIGEFFCVSTVRSGKVVFGFIRPIVTSPMDFVSIRFSATFFGFFGLGQVFIRKGVGNSNGKVLCNFLSYECI